MKSVVIGIAGGTASGKSTVSAAVAERLGEDCVHIVHDRYYKSLPAHLVDNPSLHNFDHPDALDTALMAAHLDQLREGRGVHLPQYDFTTHSQIGDADWVEPKPVILVEGILVLADEALRKRFDHAIYVHTPDDLRLARRIRRDRAERGRTTDAILTQYELTVRPMHEAFVAPSRAHANLVLNGTQAIGELVAQVLARIQR